MNPFLHFPIARRLPTPLWRRPRRMIVRGGQRGLRQALGMALLAAGVVQAPAHALDLNDATVRQLEGIRGIGPRTAEIIVLERDRAGKFESLQDLADRVRGISQKKAAALGAAGLTVGVAESGAKEAGAAPAGAASATVGTARTQAAAIGASLGKAGTARSVAKPVAAPRP